MVRGGGTHRTEEGAARRPPGNRETTNRVAAAREVAARTERASVNTSGRRGTHVGGSHAGPSTRVDATPTRVRGSTKNTTQSSRVASARTRNSEEGSGTTSGGKTARDRDETRSTPPESTYGGGTHGPAKTTSTTTSRQQESQPSPNILSSPQRTLQGASEAATHGGGSHSVLGSLHRNTVRRNGPTTTSAAPAANRTSRSSWSRGRSSPRELEEALLPERSTPDRRQNDDGEEDCCHLCCSALCQMCLWCGGCCLACMVCGCRRGSFRNNGRSTEQSTDVDDLSNHGCGDCDHWFCRCIACIGLCCGSLLISHKSVIPVALVTIALFLVTISISGTHQTWTLNAGESRQVVPGWFTDRVDIQVTSAPHEGSVDVSVYALPTRCPKLTGPIVSTYHEYTMTLGPLDYQYDFFYLHESTKLDATFAQTMGFSDVYLLRGQEALSTLQGQHDENEWSELLRRALKKWEVNVETKVDGHLNDTYGTFQIAKSDVYTLLYDNPSQSSRGQLLVDLWLDMTTYNLKGYSPTCSDLAFQRCRPIETEFAKCILVDTWKNGNDEVTTIQIVGHRDWTFIVLLSLLPGFLSMVWYLITCCGKTNRRREVIFAEDIEHERPPPTAPRNPTAPPAAYDLDN